MTDLFIEHQCPQCGAPATLKDTDRLFQCEFCRVRSYLTVPDVFRYILPSNAPPDKQIIYFPYWRFKGMLFYYISGGIKNKIIDVSHQALPSMHFPISVGLRSQTQKLRFATVEPQDIFLQPHTPFKQVLKLIDKRFSTNLPKPIIHQAHIGETLGLLYAPFYLDNNKLYDAILNCPVGNATSETIMPLLARTEEPQWPLKFIATLCPQCGWDLTGERDSLALNCTNCQTVWHSRNQQFEQINTAYIPKNGDQITYMPFWRIQADINNLTLETYADLVKIANLPKVVQPGWDHIPFHFWTPAFKVRPQSFLTIASKVTISQLLESVEPDLPKGRLHPITLLLSEAVESLTLNLAGFLKPHQLAEELIPNIKIKARSYLLVYLPFEQGHHELIHSGMNLAINNNILVHSKNL